MKQTIMHCSIACHLRRSRSTPTHFALRSLRSKAMHDQDEGNEAHVSQDH